MTDEAAAHFKTPSKTGQIVKLLPHDRVLIQRDGIKKADSWGRGFWEIDTKLDKDAKSLEQHRE